MLTHIIEPSAHRVEPDCQHFHACGGCSFQHLAREKQLSAKADWLQGQLRHLITTQPLELLSDASIGYRRRARIAIDHKNGQMVLGFRGKASNDIVAIDRCVVLTDKLQVIFHSLKQALSVNTLSTQLGHVELLEDTKGVSVLFRLISPVSTELEAVWEDWAKKEKYSTVLASTESEQSGRYH